MPQERQPPPAGPRRRGIVWGMIVHKARLLAVIAGLAVLGAILVLFGD